ncbi:autotransporter outer membrane beta-barrel domain-containing protein [Helicobacter himalayensis]|uniref:autotransporter outer membrane beta-barrel domain-containing protein n=1 Tax=Helicobacter himalayensis TaxID=1591088 RepID=UPI003D6DAAEB
MCWSFKLFVLLQMGLICVCGIDKVILEGQSESFSGDYSNDSASSLTLGERASFAISGAFSNQGNLKLDSGAHIVVDGAFTHIGNLSFSLTQNNSFGSISAQSVSFGANAKITLATNAVLFGASPYALITSTEPMTQAPQNLISFESTSPYAKYITLVQVQEANSLGASFALNAQAKAQSTQEILNTLNKQEIVQNLQTYEPNTLRLFDFLKDTNEIYGVGMLSALLANNALENGKIIVDSLKTSARDLRTLSQYDALMLHWNVPDMSMQLRSRMGENQKSASFASLVMGSASFGKREQSLFGFNAGFDRKFLDSLLLGAFVGYVSGGDDYRILNRTSSQNLSFGAYGRLYSAHNELDFLLYGGAGLNQSLRNFVLFNRADSQSSASAPFIAGAKLRYGYVFDFALARAKHIFKPLLGIHVYYYERDSFDEKGNLPFYVGAESLFFQTLEAGFEYKISLLKNTQELTRNLTQDRNDAPLESAKMQTPQSFLFFASSIEWLLDSKQNTFNVQLAGSNIALNVENLAPPKGFVNVLVGGELAYKKRLSFRVNARYKTALYSQESLLANMLNFEASVKFGFSSY